MVGFEEPRAAALDALAWARPSALAKALRDSLLGRPAVESLLDAFSEEDEHTSRAPSQWQEQLRLALVALAVLLVGQQVNALLGYVAASLRRRRLARDMALDGAGGAARTAVWSWVRFCRVAFATSYSISILTTRLPLRRTQQPARLFGRQPVKRSTWDDASLLVGDWVLDADASDSLEGLYDVLDYGWRERLAASYLTRLSIEEDQKTWRLVVMAAGLVYGAALDETYLKTGVPTLVPRRDMPGDGDAPADGQADGRPLCEARAAPLDGGVEVTHVLGDPSRGLLREWFGVTEEPGDGEAVLVRETVYKLESGEEWSGVLVYRTSPPEPMPGEKAPPAAKPLTRDAAALLSAARTRIAPDDGDAGEEGHQIGAPDEPGNAIADECGHWDESLLNAALRRVRLLPDEVVVEDKGDGDEVEAMEVEVPTGPVEAPAAIAAMADLLLSAMPRTFGGVPAREATAEEKALLESVEQLGQLRITAEQAEALRASGENVTAPPMPLGPIRERDQLQAWLAARRTRMR